LRIFIIVFIFTIQIFFYLKNFYFFLLIFTIVRDRSNDKNHKRQPQEKKSRVDQLIAQRVRYRVENSVTPVNRRYTIELLRVNFPLRGKITA